LGYPNDNSNIQIISMDLKETTSIRDIINQNIEATRVLERLRIDYWNNCNLTVSELARKTDCKVESLMDEFKIHLRKRILDPWRLDELGFTELCKYLINRHHCYARETIFLLNRKIKQICDFHGSEYPELHKIVGLFREIAENLTTHIEEEEGKILPVIADLDNTTDLEIEEVNTDRIASSLADFSKGLLNVNSLFNEIAHLSMSFSVPVKVDQTFNLVYSTLKEFEQDHHLHIYVETHVLLRKIKDS